MKVLITGGAGFIGHHVIEGILKNTSWDIVSLDRLSVSGNLNRLTSMEIWPEQGHRVKSVHHDLRSPINSQIAHALGEFDYILHLGASTHVDRSIEDPMAFVLDNVVGTTNILQFARMQKNLISFLYFSTDEVFGPAPAESAFKEWDRYNAGNPYAAAKAGGEEMALAFANTYNIPLIITHTMNVFGERQHPEKFIPMTIKKILRGEKLIIHADKTKTKAGSRYWIHARNVADALIFLLLRPDLKPADKFNIVGEKEVDNLQMASFIHSVLGDFAAANGDDVPAFDYEMVDFHSSRPGHDLRYALDGEKMKSMGWSLPIDFEASLNKTILWLLENKKDWLGI